MNNTYLNIINPNKNNSLTFVQNFIEKIKNNLTEVKFKKFIEIITKLINSLIDICIKNKIDYFLTNNISFSSIKSNFLIELENVLINIISKIIPDIEKNFMEISVNELENIETLGQMDKILIILFKKQDNKNRVSFNPTATQYIYKEEEENNIKKTKKKSKPVKIDLFGNNSDNMELPSIYKICLLIKIFFLNNMDEMILQQQIYNICKIINDTTIEYDVLQPYKFLEK